MNEIKNNVLDKIKTGKVTMRPRWHFVLQAFLLLASVVLVALVAVYLFSFIIFTLDRSGLLFAPQYGWHGMMMFIVSSPLLIIGILLAFLLLLYILVSRYSFSYRKPLVYSIVGMVLLVVTASFLIQHFNVHDKIYSFTEQHHVPGMTPLYEKHLDRKPPGIERGTITETQDTGFTLLTEQGTTVTVITDVKTKISPEVTLEVSEEVMVFGDTVDNALHAFGVRSAGEDELPPPPPEHKKPL